MKGKKTKNTGLLETLQAGPESHYGNESDWERECVDEAKKWLLYGIESREYRAKLLDALISFKVREARCDGDIGI